MPKIPSSLSRPENNLLAHLPKADYQRLAAHLQDFPLVLRHILYKARGPIEYVYFPVSGVVSAMTVMEDGSAIEVATIGNEGMTGLTAFIGGEASPNDVDVQVEGNSVRMRADVLKKEASKDGPLRRILIRYNTAYATQVSYSVACNGLHKVEKRCCRWLLMTADRVGSDVLPLTHELLAIMLGVQRSSLTEVLHPLQKRGLIQNSRGKIRVLDRAGLEATACERYRAVKEEYVRQFG